MIEHKNLAHKIEDLFSYTTENTLHSHYKHHLEMLCFFKNHKNYINNNIVIKCRDM